ncbi:hypothetical protein FX988_03527 [Paraglaciecola mesophila]|uniref:Transmembrane protein n=1 Tax=Paraglaciecola mesophila TaxID=197222 RepID=A0A857JP60_9ALTE|nr:hypothetical protein [Paraglaciecola mesophila]QHJ13266.1 hypothetical protein FX988_03527 [Paraglaciecola mesophila]
MKKSLTWANSLDWFLALLALLTGLAVLHTFVLGEHYIIPTILLVVSVILGNLAWYGFAQVNWAKRVNFWCGFLLTSHGVFALFWSKKYREVLGDQFELVCAVITLTFLVLTWMYAKNNKLFAKY